MLTRLLIDRVAFSRRQFPFLAQSYVTSLQAQSAASVPSPSNADGSSQPSSTRLFHTDVAWFLGLGTSLSSAVLAALLQSWIRRYMVMTQAVQNPRARALIRAHVILEKSLLSLQLATDFLHLLLDFAIFAFLFGLIWLLPTNKSTSLVNLGPWTSNFSIVFVAFPLFLWYLIITLLSVRRHTIYSTPLSRVIRHIFQDIKLTLWGSFAAFFKPSGGNAFLGFDWMTLDSVHQVAERLTKSQIASLDREIVTWLLRSLNHDQDLERLLECLPGFYHSDLVRQPEQILHPLHTNEMPRAILAFLHRTLSSHAIPNETKHNRVWLFLEVMEQDPYLLERTFFHILSLPARPIIFQCIDFVRVADRFAFNANWNRNTQLIMRCIIAIAISRLGDHELVDERRLSIIERWLSSRISDTTSHRQVASMKLLNLICLAKELNSAAPEYTEKILSPTLRAVCDFPVEDVEPEYQNEFCVLWNKLLDSADGAPASNASLILPRIRSIYNITHGGTTDFPVNATHTFVHYPHCVIHTHLRLNPHIANHGPRK